MPMHISPSINKDPGHIATMLPRISPIANPLPSATQSDILDILQREQDRAVALLSSSPLLASLFVSYANQAAVLDSVTATPSSESDEWKSLENTIATLQEEVDRLKPENVEMAKSLEAAAASQEAFRSQVSALKEVNTTQLGDIKTLRAELFEAKRMHDHLLVDSDSERESLQTRILELEARKRELEGTIVEQQVQMMKFQYRGGAGLSGFSNAPAMETAGTRKFDRSEGKIAAEAPIKANTAKESAEQAGRATARKTRVEGEAKERDEEERKATAYKMRSAWGAKNGEHLAQTEQKNEWANSWNFGPTETKNEPSGLPPIITSSIPFASSLSYARDHPEQPPIPPSPSMSRQNSDAGGLGRALGGVLTGVWGSYRSASASPAAENPPHGFPTATFDPTLETIQDVEFPGGFGGERGREAPFSPQSTIVDPVVILPSSPKFEYSAPPKAPSPKVELNYPPHFDPTLHEPEAKTVPQTPSEPGQSVISQTERKKSKKQREKEKKEREERERIEWERIEQEREEKAIQDETEREARKREREERERREQEQEERVEQEMLAKEARERAELHARQRAEHEAKERADREARERADREAKERAECAARAERQTRETQERAEREAKEQAEAREKMDKLTRKRAEREAAKEAKEKAEREAKEKAEREAKEKMDKLTRKRAEREAAKEAKERAEREVKEKAEREAKERVDEAARVKAEREAKRKAEKEAREQED